MTGSLRLAAVIAIGGAALFFLSECGSPNIPKSSSLLLRPLTPTQRRELLPFVRVIAPRCIAMTRWYRRRANNLVIGGTADQNARWDVLFTDSISRERSLIHEVERRQTPRFARPRVRAFVRALRGDIYVVSLGVRLDREGRSAAAASPEMFAMADSATNQLRRTARLLGLKTVCDGV